MLDSIENTYNNIHIFNQEKWIYNELFALTKALAKHIFITDILTATEINIGHLESFGRGRVAGATDDNIGGGKYKIVIYDYAYNAPLDGNSNWAPNNIVNFEGTKIHELTHVAVNENPSILASYKAEKKKHPFELPTIGSAYDWQGCRSNPDCDSDEERLALATTVWHLSPGTFDTYFYTDWRKYWLQSYSSLDNVNPFVDFCYGSYK
jgi:hypothetical protein